MPDTHTKSHKTSVTSSDLDQTTEAFTPNNRRAWTQEAFTATAAFSRVVLSFQRYLQLVMHG